MVSTPPNNVFLKIKDANVVWKKKSPGFFFFSPQRPYLWVSDGGRDIYMNLTQTAWTSWVCSYQAVNFTRTELFFQEGGGVAEISCTSCFNVAGIETKTVFQDFKTWSLLESGHADVHREGTRMFIWSHVHQWTYHEKHAGYSQK